MAKAIEMKKAPAATPPSVKLAEKKKVKADKLPFGKKHAGIVMKAQGKLTKALRRVLAMPEGENPIADKARTDLRAALVSLELVSTALVSLPDTFTPKGSGDASVGGAIVVGGLVQVREKRRADYEGLLDAADLAALTVLHVKGAKLAVKTPSGNKLIVPKAHVQPAQPKA